MWINRLSKVFIGSLLCGAILLGTGCTVIEAISSEYNNYREQQTMNSEEQSIGQATMEEDGTIILRLRAESDDGAVGESLFTYATNDADYQSILDHIGGLNPGESKPVPPWDD